jgi:hypothetical protein
MKGHIDWQTALDALIAVLFGVPAVYVIRKWSARYRRALS